MALPKTVPGPPVKKCLLTCLLRTETQLSQWPLWLNQQRGALATTSPDSRHWLITVTVVLFYWGTLTLWTWSQILRLTYQRLVTSPGCLETLLSNSTARQLWGTVTTTFLKMKTETISIDHRRKERDSHTTLASKVWHLANSQIRSRCLLLARTAL